MREILVVLALALLNGYFAKSELAVVSARPARLQARAGTADPVRVWRWRSPTSRAASRWRSEAVELDGRRIDKMLVRPSSYARGGNSALGTAVPSA